jgi:hypothetical protein
MLAPAFAITVQIPHIVNHVFQDFSYNLGFVQAVPLIAVLA